MENHDIVILDSVDDDVLQHRETTQTRAQIVSAPPGIGISGERVEPLCEGRDDRSALSALPLSMAM
jgi:hypothetical protein